MTISPDNKYTKMQKRVYNGLANPMYSNDKKVNKFKPMRYLYEGISGKNKIALDFGCGLGRAIILFRNKFKRIDGCDLMDKYIDKARVLTKKKRLSPRLYVTDGISLKGIPSNYYDVVFSSSVLQHICVYEIRYAILEDMYRVLKKGGWVSIEMGFGNTDGLSNYYDNNYDADGTNCAYDVKIDFVGQIKGDLEKIGFKNFSHHLEGKTERIGDSHEYLIFFRAQK